MIMSRVKDNLQPNHELKDTCERVFGIPPDERDALREYRQTHDLGYNYLAAPDHLLLPYAAWDTALTFRLYNYFCEIMTEADFAVYAREMAVRKIMFESECRGIHVNAALLSQKYHQIKEDDGKLLQKIYALRGREFNASSDVQVGQWLFGEAPDGLGLRPLAYTPKAQRPQVDDLTLIQLARPEAQLLREHNSRTTVLGYMDSYLELLDNNDCLHPSFNTLQARTSRMSSSQPNLQQVKKHEDTYNIREIFDAMYEYLYPGADAFLLEADYSKQELRIAAEVSKDPGLTAAIREGRDVYTEMAAAGFGLTESGVTPDLRQAAKVASLAICYGAGAAKIAVTMAVQTGKPFSQEDATAFRNNFRRKYPQLATYMREISKRVEQTGRVETAYGRTLFVDPAYAYKAFNAEIQGTAADETKVAILYLLPLLDSVSSYIIGPIHDSVVDWLPELPTKGFLGRMRAAMDQPRQDVGFKIPAVVEIKVGKTWGTMHDA